MVLVDVDRRLKELLMTYPRAVPLFSVRDVSSSNLMICLLQQFLAFLLPTNKDRSFYIFIWKHRLSVLHGLF